MVIERLKMFELLNELTREKKISVEARLVIMQEMIDRYDELLPPKEVIRLLS